MTVTAVDRFVDFNDVAVGHSVTIRREITAAAVNAFAELSGDFNPIHVNEQFAQRSGFAKRVVHGALLAAYLSCLFGVHFPGPGCLWTKQGLEWRTPVFVGDVIDFQATVKHKSVGTRTLVLVVEAKNQDGRIVMTGEGAVRVMAA